MITHGMRMVMARLMVLHLHGNNGNLAEQNRLHKNNHSTKKYNWKRQKDSSLDIASNRRNHVFFITVAYSPLNVL